MEAPSKLLLSIEAIRAIYEYGMGWLLNLPLRAIAPRGDGHPVMVIPGLGTTDSATHYLRNFLENLGYAPYSWGLGRNMGPRQGFDPLLQQLVARLREISAANDGKQVSIVGWSLGGIYAREIAKVAPDLVRNVITLGTPFKGEAGGTHATGLYEILSKDKSHKDPDVLKRISIPPPVPFTSVYSKTDGVVHWRCSIEDTSETIENVEILGASHLGLGHNPVSMYIIADRLSQTRDGWKPYSR